MRISSKARYGLASMIFLALISVDGENITVVSISEKLGISKIYLEQVFSLLKRAGLVISVKGALGGYQLTRKPEKITAYEIIYAIETSLFERTDASVEMNSNYIELAMEGLVWDELDRSIAQTLKKVTLADLKNQAENNMNKNDYMFYI